MALKYTVTSFSEGRKGGQITVTVGEGRNKRSFTRHLSPALIGLNIDERAIPLNELYEDELAIANGDLACAEARLKGLKKGLEDAKAQAKVALSNDIASVSAGIIAELETAITRTELEVYAAKFIVDDAEAKLDIGRRELPLMMRFYRD